MTKKPAAHKLLPPVPAAVERVMAFDLGPKNTAVAVVEIRFDQGRPVGFKVLHMAMVPNLIDDLTTEFDAKARKFRSEVVKIVKYFEPNWVLFERFQQRAMRKGAVDEKVSIMNGIITAACQTIRPKSQVSPVTAGQWKNRFSQFFGPDCLTLTYAENKKCVHMIDALLIALYAYDLFGIVAERRLLSPLIRSVVGKFTPAPSPAKPTSKRARSPRARPISPKRGAKAGASTISSKRRK